MLVFCYLLACPAYVCLFVMFGLTWDACDGLPFFAWHACLCDMLCKLVVLCWPGWLGMNVFARHVLCFGLSWLFLLACHLVFCWLAYLMLMLACLSHACAVLLAILCCLGLLVCRACVSLACLSHACASLLVSCLC